MSGHLPVAAPTRRMAAGEEGQGTSTPSVLSGPRGLPRSVLGWGQLGSNGSPVAGLSLQPCPSHCQPYSGHMVEFELPDPGTEFAPLGGPPLASWSPGGHHHLPSCLGPAGAQPRGRWCLHGPLGEPEGWWQSTTSKPANEGCARGFTALPRVGDPGQHPCGHQPAA